jgi:sugar phosphate isomerase/epimerase
MDSKKVSRRMVIKSGLAACAGVCALGKIAEGAEEEKKMEALKKAKKQMFVGLQLYTVRKECEKDFPGTIAQVAKMGYQCVEFAGYYDRKPEEIRKMLGENNIRCCGTNTQLDTLLKDNLARTIEFNKVIGNRYLIVPWLDPKKYTTKAAWQDAAKLFNDLAENVNGADMMIGYHAHQDDFKPIDGETPWDILFSNTTKNVIMQLDTGNCLQGGGDPVAILKKYPGRSVTIHLKEYSKTNKKALIGEGDVKWNEVFEVCESTGGTRCYVIEEESGAYPPIEGAQKSLENFKKIHG